MIKKSQLTDLYCNGLVYYYNYTINKNEKIKEAYAQKAEYYCASIGNYEYKPYKDYYMQNMAKEHEH